MSKTQQIDDGGPAFACAGDSYSCSAGSTGMSLRTYIATNALVGLLSNEEIVRGAMGQSQTPGTGGVPAILSRAAFTYADEMLAEIAKAEGRAS